MAKSAAEIFNDKVRIIYEYDNQSPLFVRMANTEIENNNVDLAVEILNKGIETYPQYPTAYLLLGRAYTLVGNYSTALRYIKKGSDLMRSKKTYEFYFKELENNKKQRSLFQGSSRSFFAPGYDDLSENPGTLDFGSKNHTENKAEVSVDEHLEQIAKEISNARIPEASEAAYVKDELLADQTGNMIVSETLAKIYTAQGELKEAIDIYKKLIIKDSSKEKYYLEKISELKSQLES